MIGGRGDTGREREGEIEGEREGEREGEKEIDQSVDRKSNRQCLNNKRQEMRMLLENGCKESKVC